MTAFSWLGPSGCIWIVSKFVLFNSSCWSVGRRKNYGFRLWIHSTFKLQKMAFSLCKMNTVKTGPPCSCVEKLWAKGEQEAEDWILNPWQTLKMGIRVVEDLLVLRTLWDWKQTFNSSLSKTTDFFLFSFLPSHKNEAANVRTIQPQKLCRNLFQKWEWWKFPQ